MNQVELESRINALAPSLTDGEVHVLVRIARETEKGTERHPQGKHRRGRRRAFERQVATLEARLGAKR